ncbi:unnamed protein product [Lactuca saligna]|uniref:Myosin motor domain-containing protein n=1 Tax=Lactuca saligna TaxID=75948 RepID=A0AA36A4I7_LACSI|nr:unnamed protein product [Lactuca saligna]
MIVRSSLEEMLDSLQRKEESKKPADLPPALPARPASRARLPKRPGLAMFGVSPEVGDSRKQDVVSNGSFGRKNVLETPSYGESPYTMAAVHEHRLAENGGANLATPSPPPSLASGWDNSIDYYIKKQLRVWCRVQNGFWELGKIQSAFGGKASVILLDGTVMTVSTRDLFPTNTEILDGVNNLVELGYLNEPSVLCNIQYRYQRDVIYTMVGPVLLAINPFKDVSVAGNDVIMAYKEKILESPHAYKIADAAYTHMMRDGVNQSIIISGESGAGKSVTAKLVMEYLIEAGKSEMSVKISQTCCILEAFGNAKTSRNKNSSRFGKLVDIHYNSEWIICGAYIHTLLLEKSRISHLCRSERSYHIFYQMCAGAPSDMRDKLNLRMASEYKFLNQSGCLKIHDVDDAQNFKKLMEAMDALQISHEDQERVFKLVASILWLGNISFEVIDHENHVQVVTDEASRSAARLMGCNVKDLMMTLSTNKNQQQAIDVRDALVKFVYTSVFSWIVETINKSLKGESGSRCISILDIYGFESFQKNSFDQLLINYANERLQQHFVRHIFKLEQEEYESEGIEWKKVEFVDNQGCLDLFEKKNMGILSILDEASNTSEATDLTFFNKIKQHLILGFDDEKGSFKVNHYAGEVKYESTGFLEKNRDTLHSDTLQFLSSSCNNFLKTDFDNQTLGTKFKYQLFKMFQMLEKSNPHFIRCIRPNAKQLQGTFDKETVLQQLRCSGILEIIKISKSRYPTRMSHQEFANRFGCLLLSKKSYCQDVLSTSVAVLQQFRVLPEAYQLGYTKIYFRQEQFLVLEKLRKQVMENKVEKGVSGIGISCDFRELMAGVLTLQSFIRGENSRRKWNVVIKKPREKSVNENLNEIVYIQSVCRGWLARKYFSHVCSWKMSTKGMLQDNLPIMPSDVIELQKMIIKGDMSLSQKEQENEALRDQIKQFETRWSEHEIKMKSVEEAWQKQIASLQKSLVAAKKSLGDSGGDGVGVGGISSGTQTLVEYNGGGGGGGGVVDHLSKELDQKTHDFDDNAKAIIGQQQQQMPYLKQMEEFKKVKDRFEIWKKEYKNRLKETRAKLVKGVNGEGGGTKQSWWGKLSKRY